jgi:transcriptional regulator with XRE-family HTH domain
VNKDRAAIFVAAGTVAQVDGPVVKWLRWLRDEAGIKSQTKAADKIGVSPSSWAGWEAGNNLPGQAAMDKIAQWAGPDAMADLERRLAAPGSARKAQKPAAVKPAGTADAEEIMVAIIGSRLGDREKAMLCAALVAMNAGIAVRVEILA